MLWLVVIVARTLPPLNCGRRKTDLGSEGDEDGQVLPLVADDHAVGDASELRLELVLKKKRKRMQQREASERETNQETHQ